MKTLFYTIFLSISLFITSCSGKAQNQNSTDNMGNKTEVSGPNRIEILDFHNEHRCVSCVSIESYAKETLNTYFAKEMQNGKITFTLLNADDPKNETMVEKYKAYGSTLVLNVIIDGKETAHDITEFAFLNSEDKNKFIAEFKLKMEEQLAKL